MRPIAEVSKRTAYVTAALHDGLPMALPAIRRVSVTHHRAFEAIRVHIGALIVLRKSRRHEIGDFLQRKCLTFSRAIMAGAWHSFFLDQVRQEFVANTVGTDQSNFQAFNCNVFRVISHDCCSM